MEGLPWEGVVSPVGKDQASLRGTQGIGRQGLKGSVESSSYLGAPGPDLSL